MRGWWREFVEEWGRWAELAEDSGHGESAEAYRRCASGLVAAYERDRDEGWVEIAEKESEESYHGE